MVVISLNIQDTDVRDNMHPKNNNTNLLDSQSEIVLLNLPFVIVGFNLITIHICCQIL